MTTLNLPARLDHVVVNVTDDLDAAADRYRRLGFQLTPRGHHTLGTSNNLAIFGSDYLELLGFEPGREGSRPEIVQTPPGLSGLVFKPPADPDFTASLRAAGLTVEGPREFSRPVALPDGTAQARFRTVHLMGALQSGRVFFCHHDTPELVWRDEWRHHPNGAVAITGFTVAATDPARTAAPFATLFGAGALRPEAGGVVLRTETAAIRFLLPDRLRTEYGDAIVPIEGEPDRMVALELRTASLAAARDALRDGGVEFRETDTLLVPAAEACGVALRFVA